MTSAAIELDLDDLIRQYVNLGEKDPLDIAKRIEQEHGDDLGALLLPYAETIIRERARHALGSVRRSKERALGDDDDATAQAVIKTVSIFIDGPGWMRLGDCTADDLEIRARHYEKIASLNHARATWCREVAMLMREAGVKTVGKMKNIPPIPGGEL